MGQELWTNVDQYLNERLVEPDDGPGMALESNAASGLTPYDVSPSQGKLLYLLARISSARQILEIGTLGGYSHSPQAHAGACRCAGGRGITAVPRFAVGLSLRATGRGGGELRVIASVTEPGVI